jgi:gliding motility-associated-like protein
MKRNVFVILLILWALYAHATHNRAGEITYQQLSALTYKVTITTYTATGPGWTADRDQLEIMWGDGTSSILPRVELIDLPDFYRYNRYEGTHTFPGPGIYELVVEDPNRNLGVENIPNSVNTLFSISTTLMISADLGSNNTPVLTQPPIDKAAVGQIFIHNPGAFDPDGDSISYKLTICRGTNGEPIPNYSFPPASNSLTINEITGDLVWDAPTQTGVYNIAILIEEWRTGVKIGEIIRDMQIEVYETDNLPPEVIAPSVICVEADSLLILEFTATDPDADSVILSAYGGPFLVMEGTASFEWEPVVAGESEGRFRWQTVCAHVRKQPYLLNIKAEDNSSPISLVDIKNINIYVVGPAVKNVQLTPTSNSITVSWNQNRCTEVVGYNVYRRITASGFVPDFCEIGVPEETGYELVGTTDGYSNTIFIDNNNGSGLPQGFEYCYMITAIFPDGVEGYASEEVCTELIRGIPTITNVSVLETDESTGKIYLAWSKPTEFDTVQAQGPYKYLIYRSDDLWGENLQLIDSTFSINDTIYNDSDLNTLEYPFSYKIEFYNDEPGNRFLIGTPHIASSIFLDIEEGDNELKINFLKNVPWQNQEYHVFRFNENSFDFDSIGFSEEEFFIDSGLVNGEEYCYYVKSKGSYSVEGIINPIINLSHEQCASPVDTLPPATPVLYGESVCDSTYNRLLWEIADSSYYDVFAYNLYYSPTLEGESNIIFNPHSRDSTHFLHYPITSMAGCYYVTAIDSFLNESPPSNRVCLDNCIYYKLPNIFTPNADGYNDIYTPVKPYYFVEKIDIKITNRWGIVVYETDDPEINWDGRYFKNNKLVSDGVYFYTCDVYERRITGIEVRHLTGFIHVMSGRDEQPITE